MASTASKPTLKELRATLHLRRDGAIEDYQYNPLAAYCRDQGMLEEFTKNKSYRKRGIKHVRLTLLGWETLTRLNNELGYDHQYE